MAITTLMAFVSSLLSIKIKHTNSRILAPTI